jgi:hypothetical protein
VHFEAINVRCVQISLSPYSVQFCAVRSSGGWGGGAANCKVNDLLASQVGMFCARDEKSTTIDRFCVLLAIVEFTPVETYVFTAILVQC